MVETAGGLRAQAALIIGRDRMSRAVHIVGLIVILGMSTGCGSGTQSAPTPVEAQDKFQQIALEETGEMFKFRKGDTGKPPKSAADFARYEPGLPGGYSSVKNGDIVVVWGAETQDGATDKVLAYEKKAPESGGYVLMQDGTTVKKLTAEEFKSAPKAGGK